MTGARDSRHHSRCLRRISGVCAPALFQQLHYRRALSDHVPAQQHLHASDGFSKVVGKHTLKFGGEFRYLQVNERNLASQDGAFIFDGTVTGVDFADYLLGAPTGAGDGYSQAALQLLDSRTRYGGAYAQDTWKSNTRPYAEPRPALGSQHALVRHAGQDPDLGSGRAVDGVSDFSPRSRVSRRCRHSQDTGAHPIQQFRTASWPRLLTGFSDGVLGKVFGGPGKSSIRASFGMYYTSVEDLNLFYEVGDAPFGLYWTSPGTVLFRRAFPKSAGRRHRRRGTALPVHRPDSGQPGKQDAQFRGLRADVLLSRI